LLEEQRAPTFASTEQASGPIAGWYPTLPAKAIPSVRSWAWVAPVLLGVCFALAAALLVVVELGQPPRTPEFRGIRFSNTVNSPGSRAIVQMYREHMGWLPRPYSGETLDSSWYVRGLVTGWGSMVALQIAAIVVCRRTRATSAAVWAIGPVLASLVFLLYPPSSTDIYAYSSFGWVADKGANPYLVSPESLPGDPYAAFNDWTMVRSPYGPLWTGVSRALVHLSNGDPFATTLGFKIVTTLAAFALAVLTYQVARRFTDDRHLALIAFVLVCWSPILITEAAATVHLDPVMMLPAMLGFAIATCAGPRHLRIAIILTTVSALVKPATLPLIALLILTRLARPERIVVTARRITLDLVTAIGMIAVAYAPFWDRTLAESIVRNMNQLYVDEYLRSNPLWVWGLDHVDAVLGLSAAIGGNSGSTTRIMSMAAAAIVGIVLVTALWQQRRTNADEMERSLALRRFLLVSWAAVTVIIGILPVNAHPWYVVWSMVPLALLWVTDGRRVRERPPVWVLGIQTWVLFSFMIYHTLPKH